jgi:hypothetical protein
MKYNIFLTNTGTNICIKMSLYGLDGEILDVPFIKIVYSLEDTNIDHFTLQNKSIGKVSS